MLIAILGGWGDGRVDIGTQNLISLLAKRT